MMHNSTADFIDGQRCCVEGRLCPVDATNDFKSGFGYQYELEQIAEHHPKLAKKIKQTKDLIK